MPMSEDELRRLRELEAELAQHRRMVNLANRLGSASVDARPQRVTALLIASGSAGLSLVVAGAVVHSAAMLTAALVILAATLVLAALSSVQPKWPGTGGSIARVTVRRTRRQVDEADEQGDGSGGCRSSVPLLALYSSTAIFGSALCCCTGPPLPQIRQPPP